MYLGRRRRIAGEREVLAGRVWDFGGHGDVEKRHCKICNWDFLILCVVDNEIEI